MPVATVTGYEAQGHRPSPRRYGRIETTAKCRERRNRGERKWGDSYAQEVALLPVFETGS